MKKKEFFNWLQKYSSLFLRKFLPEVVEYVNKLIELRAKEKVSDSESVALEETVLTKIKRFWSPTDTKCRAFWVLLVIIVVVTILMSILWNFRFISVFISAIAILKFVFKAVRPAEKE